jgi:hypothetical protein
VNAGRAIGQPHSSPARFCPAPATPRGPAATTPPCRGGDARSSSGRHVFRPSRSLRLPSVVPGRLGTRECATAGRGNTRTRGCSGPRSQIGKAVPFEGTDCRFDPCRGYLGRLKSLVLHTSRRVFTGTPVRRRELLRLAFNEVHAGSNSGRRGASSDPREVFDFAQSCPSRGR